MAVADRCRAVAGWATGVAVALVAAVAAEMVVAETAVVGEARETGVAVRATGEAVMGKAETETGEEAA